MKGRGRQGPPVMERVNPGKERYSKWNIVNGVVIEIPVTGIGDRQ